MITIFIDMLVLIIGLSALELIEWLIGGLAIAALYLLFRGSDRKMDNQEKGGFVLTLILAYMLYKEGQREHEWQLYSEAVKSVIALAIVASFSITPIGNAFGKNGNGNVKPKITSTPPPPPS